MTNAIAKQVHCPTCGAPPGRACRALDPGKDKAVPNHSARRKIYRTDIPTAVPGTIAVLFSDGSMNVMSSQGGRHRSLANARRETEAWNRSEKPEHFAKMVEVRVTVKRELP